MIPGPPRVFLGEDVDILLAALLRARGFDAVHTVEVARIGSSDCAQLRYSAENGRAILTHNRVHFEALATAFILRPSF